MIVKKYPKILLPTNLTPSALNAADFIVSLLGRNAEYELLNSFPLTYRSGFYDTFQNYAPDYDEIPLEKLKRERNRLIKKFGNQSIEIKAMYGDPVRDLINSSGNSVDLVVLGEEQFSGWNYQKISKVKTSMIHLEIPLIFVPNLDSFDKVGSVLLIQDVTSRNKTESIKLMRQLCAVSGVPFLAILVDEESTADQVVMKSNLNFLEEEEEVKIVRNRLILNELLLDTVDSNSIIVSNIQHDDTKLAEHLQHLFEDRVIVQTKLLMPKSVNENLLRGA
ncbi:MAG: hypothetical protein Crog4KO_02930 [Crocinitomicaceae bacterium]